MYTIRPCGSRYVDSMPCDYSTAITPKCKRRKCNNDWYAHAVEPESKVHKGRLAHSISCSSNFSILNFMKIIVDMHQNSLSRTPLSHWVNQYNRFRAVRRKRRVISNLYSTDIFSTIYWGNRHETVNEYNQTNNPSESLKCTLDLHWEIWFFFCSSQKLVHGEIEYYTFSRRSNPRGDCQKWTSYSWFSSTKRLLFLQKR